MRAMSASQAFAAASAAMVSGVDASSTVHVLLADVVRLLGADTTGILVRGPGQGLELLAADSHQATQLELHQANSDSGPCFDVVKTGNQIDAVGADEVKQRWSDFGPHMIAAGFHTVHAFPMTWRGRVLGGLNIFWAKATELTEEDARTAQAFADTCTLAIMQSGEGDDSAELNTKLRAVLSARVAIERAKGVLAQLHDIDMASAFLRLIQISEETAQPLSVAAKEVIKSVHPSN